MILDALISDLRFGIVGTLEAEVNSLLCDFIQ
jgi:hypothetical protein